MLSFAPIVVVFVINSNATCRHIINYYCRHIGPTIVIFYVVTILCSFIIVLITIIFFIIIMRFLLCYLYYFVSIAIYQVTKKMPEMSPFIPL